PEAVDLGDGVLDPLRLVFDLAEAREQTIGEEGVGIAHLLGLLLLVPDLEGRLPRRPRLLEARRQQPLEAGPAATQLRHVGLVVGPVLLLVLGARAATDGGCDREREGGDPQAKARTRAGLAGGSDGVHG